LEQITEQLRQAESAGDPWKAGIALNNLGDYYKDRRETGKALEHFQKALEYFTALDDAEKKATVLINLGGTYLDARQYPQALEQFTRWLWASMAPPGNRSVRPWPSTIWAGST